MDYNQTITYLFNQLPIFQRDGAKAFNYSLNTAISLDEFMQSPHKKFKTIHVAGTNGKGSVSHLLASVLQTAGYKTGLFTSPHLLDFRERIKINGNVIDQESVVNFVKKYSKYFDKLKPSFFEVTSAMAFEYFAMQNVDIAVIEVGMGGKFDSTNIITPILSVITNISYDHTQFLGNSLKEIAGEKAGIIKKNVPIVIGETDSKTRTVFIEKADKENAPLYLANHLFSAENTASSDDEFQIFNVFKGGRLQIMALKTDLYGNYQKKNIITCIQAVEVLKDKLRITTNDMLTGFSKVVQNTNLKGRWQVLGNNPYTVCDTGHNESGFEEIVRQIRQTTFTKLHFVLGILAEKKTDSMLRLLPQNAIYYFTKPGNPRALDENELEKQAQNYNLKGEVYETVSAAFHAAKKNALKDDMIFIGGSTFMVAEIL